MRLTVKDCVGLHPVPTVCDIIVPYCPTPLLLSGFAAHISSGSREVVHRSAFCLVLCAVGLCSVFESFDRAILPWLNVCLLSCDRIPAQHSIVAVVPWLEHSTASVDWPKHAPF